MFSLFSKNRSDDSSYHSSTISTKDRFVASRQSLHPITCSPQAFSHAKLHGLFDPEDKTSLRNELSRALFNTSYDDITKRSLRDPGISFQPVKIKSRVLPYKIDKKNTFDAPNVVADRSIQILALSEQLLFVALDDELFSYNLRTKKIQSIIRRAHIDDLIDNPNSRISAVACSSDTVMACAEDQLKLFDIKANKQISSLPNVGTVKSITPIDEHCFYTLNQFDSYVAHYDARTPAYTRIIYCPDVRILGLDLSRDNRTLAISCNNENQSVVSLFSPGNLMIPTSNLVQTRCSKTLAFSPFASDELLTVGGVDNATVNLWNIRTNKLASHYDHDAEITSLQWLGRKDFSVTDGQSLGRPGEYKVHCIRMHPNDEFEITSNSESHVAAILDSVKNPNFTNADRKELITISEDETVRFWSLTRPGNKKRKRDEMEETSKLTQMTIR